MGATVAWPADEFARFVDMVDSGLSNRAIQDALGRNRHSISGMKYRLFRWRKAGVLPPAPVKLPPNPLKRITPTMRLLASFDGPARAWLESRERLAA